jgi:predicted RNA-binding protein with PIN domain
LRAAAVATERVARALAQASAALSPPVVAERRDAVVPAPAPDRPPPRPRRVPLPLPGGLFADSAAAAEHLVRAPGVLLLVDGYNVAKLGWPDLMLPEQRTRLLDALDELVARFGTQVRVVFDGADVTAAPIRRRHLLVEFSPPGVLADDVIVALVASLPAEQPIVVVTNDAEVREGARAYGANVLSSQQLLTVARRC